LVRRRGVYEKADFEAKLLFATLDYVFVTGAAQQQIECIDSYHRNATDFEGPVHANTANLITNKLVEVMKSNGTNGNKRKQ